MRESLTNVLASFKTYVANEACNVLLTPADPAAVALCCMLHKIWGRAECTNPLTRDSNGGLRFDSDEVPLL